jgi:hypothetical protein
MQSKTYSITELFAILGLVPEAFLRDYSRIVVMDANLENPKFAFVQKDDDCDISFDLPPGTVDIIGIGYNQKGIMRLSASGDLPTTLATRLLAAINWQKLDVDETFHSSYGFFPSRSGRDFSHFIATRDSAEPVRLTNVGDKPITKLEFATLPNGTIEFACLSDERCYTATLKVDEIKRGFNWKPVNIPGDLEVSDISTRIIDGKVGTLMATRNGLHLYRNGEVSIFVDTKGMDVTAIAGYAGYIPRETNKAYDTVSRMGFVVRKDDNMALYTASWNPTSKAIPVVIKDDCRIDLKDDDVRIIASASSWYIGTPNRVVCVEGPLC